MKKNLEKVLDHFEEEPSKRWFQHWLTIFIPAVLFVVGAIFKTFHWKFALVLMAIGLSLIVLRSILLFMLKTRDLAEWFYFLGSLALVLALAIDFAFIQVNRKIRIASFILFCLGVLMYLLKKKNPADELADNPEDEY